MRSQSSLQPIPGLDALKAIASQLIVLHHLAYYGPMSDVAWELSPDLLAWLANHARIAVQIFLVLGGFLAAHSLAPEGRAAIEQPFAMVARRYLRLVLPFGAALLITSVCAAWARGQMYHELIPAAPHAGQFAAHLLLLHGVLDLPSLSTGAWYVAIDLQLFALMVGTLWLGQRIDTLGSNRMLWGPLLAFFLCIAALFYFNRDADFDKWGLYFCGSYMLGAGARWALSSQALRERFYVLMMLAGLSMLMDFRVRIFVAMLTACWLLLSINKPRLTTWLEAPIFKQLGRVSYAVFLIHFAVLIIVNTVFVRLFPESVAANAFGLFVAWGTSLLAGFAFHHWIERPALGWSGRIAAIGLRPLAWLNR